MISKAVELGDKIEVINTTNRNNSQETHTSVIQEILEDNCFVISAPVEKGRTIPLQLDKSYYLCIYTKRGLYRCEGVVINRMKDEHLLLVTLKVKTKMQKYQRRQYYRLDCLLSFHYKDETKELWNDGTILDISGGGIRFMSNYVLDKDEPIECHIQLNFEDEDKHIYVEGKIVDSEETEYESGNFETRVAFDNVANETRELIIRFVFEEERKRRKKQNGM